MVMGQIINEDSGISLGLLLAIIGVATVVVGSLGSILWSIRSRLGNLVRDFRRFEDEQWSIACQCEYALRLKIENPAMKIPDPRNQSKMLGGEE